MPNSFDVGWRRVDDCFSDQNEMAKAEESLNRTSNDQYSQNKVDDHRFDQSNCAGFDPRKATLDPGSPQNVHDCVLSKKGVEES